ncbi:MAG TPA: hypothetical protein DCZ01_08970 [Elusimicrobia bacterium]|nr:hypothetical protein [Elusimicrobiota bacterium]
MAVTHNILVVEDDPDIQGYCNTVLESAAFNVASCSTMAQARRLYEERRPDLVVVDIGLPDGNGIDLLREWRKLPGRPAAILFLTARGDLKTRIECFQAGAQDYLHKPFAAEELLARVKVHLEVQKSHEDLLRRNYELELITRARQDMADMIVHDLKAPLTSIKGTLQLIKLHGLISEANHANLLENAGSAADFMLLMLNDLLDVGQARQTGLKAVINPVDMAGLLEKLRALFMGRSKMLGIPLVFSVAPDAAILPSDQNLLYRILANLISNAMKVSSNGGQVEIEVVAVGDRAQLRVLDRGRGVSNADKQSIFDKYVTSSRQGEAVDTGTGLGLAFCRVATQALQGRLWVEDRDGGGSRFVLEVPGNAPTAVA